MNFLFLISYPENPSLCCGSSVQIAVFAGGVDTSATETKGTVLIHNADQVSFLVESLCGLLSLVSLLYLFCYLLTWSARGAMLD